MILFSIGSWRKGFFIFAIKYKLNQVIKMQNRPDHRSNVFISKKMSYCLRHNPDKYGLKLDEFTYGNLITTAQLCGIHLVAVKSDKEGMQAEDLLHVCQVNDIKRIYLMPEYSNPTGKVISPTRRKQLADIIEKQNLIAIEDDYLSFLSRKNSAHPLKMMQLVPLLYL